jgi:hypothetical protein
MAGIVWFFRGKTAYGPEISARQHRLRARDYFVLVRRLQQVYYDSADSNSPSQP